jgi:hypothetical protein
LIKSAPTPPSTFPPQHMGIPNSGSTGFYYSHGAPIVNYNPHAPTVGVRVANGCPERSVASAMLALVFALPPATISSHVLPFFPHTLIGQGPFANQRCKIVFDKTSVIVFHLDSHPILKGWWDLDGHWLWQFPLTASLPPPGHTPPLAPVSAGPSATMLAFQPHLSQGIQAISAAGEDISAVFLYEVTHAMAIIAQAPSTPYNPQTLDLPSISALVSFYHACLGFWVKQTWLDAIKAENCNTFNGLTYSNLARYCPGANKTIVGHLAQQHQNNRSTKPKLPTPLSSPALPITAPSYMDVPSNQVLSQCTPSAGCTWMTLAAF